MFDLLAQTTGGGGDPILPTIAQYGLLAPLMASLFWAWRRAETRGDRLEDDLKRVNDAMVDKTLPALYETTRSVKELALVMQEDRYLSRQELARKRFEAEQ